NEIPTPQIYLLGGSERSAQFAATEKVGFIYAFFINSNIETLQQALKDYKQQFPEGRVIVGVAAVVSENKEEQALVKEGSTNYALHFDDGRKITVNTKEQVETFKKQSDEDFEVEEKQIDVFNGSADEIKQQLNQLNRDGNIDEFMLHMPVQNHKLRIKTVEQLAITNNKEKQKEGVL
ncbi:MAG: LLM class flavin-dependent oxidoreductase, partial [Staphylococcus equorum]|nr:LLM class flavin-dependent oxidoreductase [Staphylococcus equorum]